VSIYLLSLYLSLSVPSNHIELFIHHMQPLPHTMDAHSIPLMTTIRLLIFRVYVHVSLFPSLSVSTFLFHLNLPHLHLFVRAPSPSDWMIIPLLPSHISLKSRFRRLSIWSSSPLSGAAFLVV
jgi:type IV secretory pathway VirB3-like protein